jgi:arylsulfotransferase ASST
MRRLAGWFLTLIALGGLPGGALASGLPPATLSFRSVPALHPPEVQVSSNPDRASGDIFLTPSHSYQAGLMILDPEGKLIWFQPVYGWVANLEKQRYQGQPVLTWWQGKTPTTSTEDVVLSRSYRIVAVLQGAGGYIPDLHEFQITPQGTALIDGIGTVTGNLTKYGGPAQGSVKDDVIQERDLKTGQVLWEWHSLGHVPISDSYLKATSSGPYDYFHLNSIQQLPGGDLLVSARDTSAVYLIDRKTGAIIWTLGGKHSSFKMGAGTSFKWQHDAHLTGHRLTLFDDHWGGGGYPEPSSSSALALRLSMTAMKATLVHRYTHSPSVISGSEGSTQTLPDGNVFVGWGSDPDFSEYSPSGRQLFNGRFAIGIKSYRAYRFPWSAQPPGPPALAVSPSASGQGTVVYASWNGATAVADWRVLAGSNPYSLHRVAAGPKTGFETTINVSSTLPYFAVKALSGDGAVLGTSHTLTVRRTRSG